MATPSAPSPTGTPAGMPSGAQHTDGEGKEATHMHEAVTHMHDHYHLTHHHRSGAGGDEGKEEWEHRTSWHTHTHTHHALTHSHDYSRQDESQRHGKEAHIHDHATPTGSG